MPENICLTACIGNGYQVNIEQQFLNMLCLLVLFKQYMLIISKKYV